MAEFISLLFVILCFLLFTAGILLAAYGAIIFVAAILGYKSNYKIKHRIKF